MPTQLWRARGSIAVSSSHVPTLSARAHAATRPTRNGRPRQTPLLVAVVSTLILAVTGAAHAIVWIVRLFLTVWGQIAVY